MRVWDGGVIRTRVNRTWGIGQGGKGEEGAVGHGGLDQRHILRDRRASTAACPAC